jgi:hypothetical protein
LAGKVTSYADEECRKDAHSGELAALGVEPDKRETTVVVAANRPLIFTFLTGSRGGPLGIAGWENMNCSMTLRFIPEESVQYTVTYARAGNQCEPVASAANSAGTPIPVELQFNPNFCPKIY